jgi:3-hydroxyacyl-CoA dehydrogenase / enoyl-CoA hydratase / 3-hydroxybutyryl-CoA epimerase
MKQETEDVQPSIRFERPGPDGIAVMWIDQPGRKVNVLNETVIPDFVALLDLVEKESGLRGIVIISGKENGFIAGADIAMLNDVSSSREGAELASGGQSAMNRLAGLRVPTVAAINGDCLGGGLEVALACTARVATDSPKTKLALPEVMLGLLPGAGGTRRLPKLIGLPNALDMMLTGKNIRSRKALRWGLVDQVVPRNKLLESAKALALSLAEGAKPKGRKLRGKEKLMALALERNPLGRKLVFHKARKTVLQSTNGLYPAPLKILDVVAADTDAAEAEGFGNLLMTDESRGLRHLFRCITELKKDNGPGTGDTEPAELSHVGMLGAGLMGAGIASVIADKGMSVRLKDISQEGISGALDYARKFYGKAVKRKIYPREGMAERMNRLSGGLGYEGFGSADIVIEAVPEILGLKQKMLADIEDRAEGAGNEVIFASNTSSLPISQIAEKAKHPERVIGMHFFSPVEKMPLVEIIVTAQTSPKTTATTVALARAMGKHVIVVNDCAGFYTTRALAPYMTEALYMMLEGYDLRDIDDAACSMGFPVGPITLMDEVGIDVGSKVIGIMKEHYGHRMEFPETDANEAFIKEGRLGKKAGKGFYLYDSGKSRMEGGRKVPDPGLQKHISTGAMKSDLPLMGRRLVLSLLNEACHCLQDGILREPLAGDLGAIMGIGFPPFEGGPFRYADRIGLSEAVRMLRELEERYGRRFAPCQLLVDKAENGESFHG